MSPAKTKALVSLAEESLRSVLSQEPPVDLFAAASARRVRVVDFRKMIPDGGMRPCDGGFEVFVRSDTPSSWVAQEGGCGPSLTRRQRFTLAHEIAHTFFFSLETPTPAPGHRRITPKHLESLCNAIAGTILIPAAQLRKDLGMQWQLRAKTIARLAARYDVSFEAAVRRLEGAGEMGDIEIPFGEALLLCEQSNESGRVRIVAKCAHYAVARSIAGEGYPEDLEAALARPIGPEAVRAFSSGEPWSASCRTDWGALSFHWVRNDGMGRRAALEIRSRQLSIG